MLESVLSRPQTKETAPRTRLHLQVQGVVQGVGFRPFVHHLAHQHGLAGFVRNGQTGVSIEIEGTASEVDAFQRALVQQAPPLSRIDRVTTTPLPTNGAVGFAIHHSDNLSAGATLVSPDVAICDDCLRELLEPTDRRHRYPFINCTNCGPRFTIVRDLPYDRPLTTMAHFDLCPTCQHEYDDPDNRRFHAQPTCCPECGPRLTFHWLGSAELAGQEAYSGEDALAASQRALAAGAVVAIKGIGGYHLACDATNERAVATLRQRKQRGDKPFAIMARDLATAQEIAEADRTECALLTSIARPIVILKQRDHTPLAPAIAPGNANVGVMLPYAPLHHLLFSPSPTTKIDLPAWLVMTSANHAGEPIVTDDPAAMHLDDLADALLSHNRPIHVPCDDSVLCVAEGAPLFIRRSRGYVPLPLELPVEVSPILAVGGEIKNAFCLGSGRQAFMSQHIGDMQTLETQEAFEHSVQHFQTIFKIIPEIVACDLHPAYMTTRWADRWVEQCDSKVRRVPVQHHHAHTAALLAEHGLRGDQPVIGFCFDGTGYGTDGAIWGGEVFLANYARFARAAHLAYLPLPGGDTTIHKPYRMALSTLWAGGIAWDESLAPVRATSPTELTVLRRQLESGLNCVSTSSMGRLFDAVASLCGIRQVTTYEAQAAIELEARAGAGDGTYHFGLGDGEALLIDAMPVLHALVSDLQRCIPASVISTRFHRAVADLVLDLSLKLRAQTGLNQVALSGGVFQNRYLLGLTLKRLRDTSFEVLIHRAVPPNDGGLALGQLMVAAHQEKISCV